jgi:ribosomal protein L4
MNQRSREELTRARRGLGSRPTHGQVVGALSFGFWAEMTHRQRTPTFWAPMVRLAFPPEAHVARGRIHDLVQNVREVPQPPRS